MERINENHIPKPPRISRKFKNEVQRGLELVHKKYGYPLFDINGVKKWEKE